MSNAEETLAKLIPDAAIRAKMVAGFTHAIGLSFADEEKSLKRDEVKRRFGICVRIFGELTRDLKWSGERALHHLPTYLKAELLGLSWVPDTRTHWIADERA